MQQEPEHYFLDITPVIHDEYGTVTELGTTRYKLEHVGVPMHLRTTFTQYAPERHPIGLGRGCDPTLMFKYSVSNADVPQPTPFEVVLGEN